MVKFHCTTCNKKLGVDEKHAGRTVKCPKCGTKMTVPQPETETVGALGTGISGVNPGVDPYDIQETTKPCKFCGKEISEEAKVCGHCKKDQSAPLVEEEVVEEKPGFWKRLLKK